MPVSWIIAVAVVIAGGVVVYRLKERAAVREFLLHQEVRLQRQIIEERDWADHSNKSGSTSMADDWRNRERRARERLARFQAVKTRCETERVSWTRMVQLLHAEGLYEDRSD